MIKSIMIDGVEALKMMVDGKSVWEKLSSDEYQPCKYLKSDGNQYLCIDDYTPQVGDSFSISFVRTRNTSYEALFSAGTSYASQLIFQMAKDGNIMAYFRYFTGAASEVKGTAQARTDPYIMNINGNGMLTIDDIENNGQVGNGSGTVDTPLYLFIRANKSHPFIGSILYFRAERNGEPILDLIPVLRISDGKPGMLNTVTGKFYTNQGTGEFLYE